MLIATLDASLPRAEALRARGVEVVAVPIDAAVGSLDLAALMRMLAERGINQVMVETGSEAQRVVNARRTRG